MMHAHEEETRTMRCISGRLRIVFGTFFLLLTASALSSSLLLRQQNDDGLIVNLSGRQRMLTQRVTHQLLSYASARDAGRRGIEERDAVLGSMRVFESTLRALDEGGRAPLDLQMTRMRESPSASPDVAAQIRRVKRAWTPYRVHAQQILEGDEAERREGVAYIVVHNTELLDEMDAVVVLVQSEAEAKVSMLNVIQAAAVLAGLLLVLAMEVFVRVAITAPLEKLQEASEEMSMGNLHRVVRVRGPLEVVTLAESFERLRLSLKTVLGGAANEPEPDPPRRIREA
jgi:methyl-accepting chemotaxis protein